MKKLQTSKAKEILIRHNESELHNDLVQMEDAINESI